MPSKSRASGRLHLPQPVVNPSERADKVTLTARKESALINLILEFDGKKESCVSPVFRRWFECREEGGTQLHIDTQLVRIVEHESHPLYQHAG